MKLANIALLLADNHGIYIPQAFAQDRDMPDWHVSAKDAAVLRAGPDHDWYWEAWQHVLDTAYFVNGIGQRWTLYQDGDLWAVCVDAMAAKEYREFFGENRE